MNNQTRLWKRRRFLFALGGIAGSAAGLGIHALRSGPSAGPAVDTPPLSTLRIGQVAQMPPFDVCIIGSGPAGVSLGLDLVRNGARTLMVESGYDPNKPAGAPRMEALQACRTSGRIDYPVRASRMRALGGTSNIWTGRCARLHPLDFEPNAYTPPENPWPVSYAELQPYYQRAERTLRVHGGELSPYHAPRVSKLPPWPGRQPAGLRGMLRDIGLTADISPSSLAGVGRGPVRMADSLLPEMIAHPNAVVVSGATVTRLFIDDAGSITGAEARDLEGRRHTLTARIFVVATGAIEAARLLLLSRSGAFPDGIGNRHDRVGRCFMEHPNLGFSGTVSRPLTDLFARPNQLVRCHQYYDELKHRGFGSALLVFNQSGVQGVPERYTRAQLRIYASLETSPEDANRVTLARDMKDPFGDPVADLSFGFSQRDVRTIERARQLVSGIYAKLGIERIEELELSWSHHHMGTCRMGDDPAVSVVDRNLRVHGTENLYIAGSASFVTGGAAHPTLLITALSHRLGEELLARLRRAGPGVAI